MLTQSAPQKAIRPILQVKCENKVKTVSDSLFEGGIFEPNPKIIHRVHSMISPKQSAKSCHLLDSRQKCVLPPVKCAPSNSCVPPAMAAVAVRIMDLDLSNDR